MVVTENNFDVTNGATHWTYCIFEEGSVRRELLHRESFHRGNFRDSLH